ncbi:glutamine synthetase family protein [Buchananella hordeovulneris]|uniref:glutamine synthetase family protein n=2 Tax=Buchananella hordeovulneris TaxID=52770 RepID=UPI000F5F29A3|nr:glutamine synthetase family protein [Buchananella hordeovulneris]RRD45525.1 glutamine synthetase [Buchananella hordeovulneris]RRD52345.1 glutamine synthetase [Buchananella hordeovulneris]
MDGQLDRQQEHVLRLVHERNVEFVRLWFTDVTGTLKSVAIAANELESAFEEGIGFDGSAIQGMSRIYESDLLLRPDASTFAMVPWRDADEGVGRLFCSIRNPDGTVAASDPRSVLQRAVAHAADRGFTLHAHPELEFYLLHRDSAGQLKPVDNGGYFDHVARGRNTDFRRQAILQLEEFGIPVEFSHHEGGPGQNEIDLRSADALTTADNIMSFRAVIQEVALSEGIIATFMPKPFAQYPGNGMHLHLSLFEGDRNAFTDPGDQYGLSRVGRQFMAGILTHAAEISAIVNQHVNSYKRLWGGGEAPSYICWGRHNRSALLRVPIYKPGKESSTRVEYRATDTATNPYLALAVLLRAGLAGIEGGYELAPEAEDDVWSLSGAERRALGIEALPSSLHNALDKMRSSDLVAETLGEEVFEFVLRNKENEWNEYRRQVTDFERAQFLPER